MGAMNKALSTMYRSGYWLQKAKAECVGKLMFVFLCQYAICADLTLRQGKRRFALIPKHHMLAHDAYDLLHQSSKAGWCENPVSRTNQIQEDFIGRPSRMSRRVNTRNMARAVILRSLVMYEDSLKLAELDSRGMDAYQRPRVRGR